MNVWISGVQYSNVDCIFLFSAVALFLYVSPNCCNKIRTKLGMADSDGFWLDVTAAEETTKRITILPDKISEDAKGFLVGIYGSVMQEIEDQVEARSNLDFFIGSGTQWIRQEFTSHSPCIKKVCL